MAAQIENSLNIQNRWFQCFYNAGMCRIEFTKIEEDFLVRRYSQDNQFLATIDKIIWLTKENRGIDFSSLPMDRQEEILEAAVSKQYFFTLAENDDTCLVIYYSSIGKNIHSFLSSIKNFFNLWRL